ncbi:class I SAM-dependent methyltransferase [Candidatus Oscillochloris fontis]|uniref:class I SAM-dependent methyltransferase n=1 Tax=Candidatus Oscillochloris fontis TaxID=2496868 RepID=UPI0013756FF1|nr:class I SAM-dependent methyltransferase [Candidatus Oscillochloris fontis]
MDPQTLAAYENQAAQIAARHRSVFPQRTHALIQRFFQPGQLTADLGCGSGRDADWLSQRGYNVIGYDASPAMLAEAQRAYPHIPFIVANLPDLAEIPAETYANILCNAVLMHLPTASLPAATQAIARILVPGGRLVLSYRGSITGDEREADGRLFTSILPADLIQLFGLSGLDCITHEAQPDEQRPTVVWQMMVIERPT